MRTRSEYQGDGSSWVLQSVVDYIYDGKRVIQERDGYNNPATCYTHGLDLSGSLEGAGGIGGLLARSDRFYRTNATLTVNVTNGFSVSIVASIYDDSATLVATATIGGASSQDITFTATFGTQYTIHAYEPAEDAFDLYDTFTPVLDHRWLTVDKGLDEHTGFETGASLFWLPRDDFYFADGNGNITALVDTNQTLSASYRYDPFGNTISQSGMLAAANVYRFSSKEIHANSGMYYYLYRFYDPELQRWINQDPIAEDGGPNLYEFVMNRPLNRIDILGLDGANTVQNASCDLCGSGPKIGSGTQSLQRLFWHIWGRSWQPNTITPTIPGIGPVLQPAHIPGSGGYWVDIGGWIHVTAKCGIPDAPWTLIGFDLTAWPSIGPAMSPTVFCVYTCGKRKSTLPGEGSQSLPMPGREDSMRR